MSKYFNVGTTTPRDRKLEGVVFKADSKEQFLDYCAGLGIFVDEYEEFELVDLTKGANNG